MSVPSTATPNVPRDMLCGAGNPLPMGPRPWGRLLRAKPAVGAARPRCRPPFSPLWPSPASGSHPLGSGGATAPPLGWRSPGCYGRASPSRRALPTGGGRCCTRCCCHAAAQTAGRGRGATPAPRHPGAERGSPSNKRCCGPSGSTSCVRGVCVFIYRAEVSQNRRKGGLGLLQYVKQAETEHKGKLSASAGARSGCDLWPERKTLSKFIADRCHNNKVRSVL